MRIFCWDYKNYEDVPKEYLEHTISYVGESEAGDSILACGYCGKEFVASAELLTCPHCNKDLIFPRVISSDLDEDLLCD